MVATMIRISRILLRIPANISIISVCFSIDDSVISMLLMVTSALTIAIVAINVMTIAVTDFAIYVCPDNPRHQQHRRAE